MNVDNDDIMHRNMPDFIGETDKLLGYMKKLSYEDLKSIWKCSDKIGKLNYSRIKNMDLYQNLTPAILSFEGLQYQYMGPGLLDYKELEYIEKRLRILSGFYGILRPFDGVVPYRLEMGAKLINWDYKNLYDFWSSKITENLFSKCQLVLNLASKEYSKAVSKYINEDKTMISCKFGQEIDGKIIEKGTLAKMARGEMVRFMAENSISELKDIKSFNRLGYKYRTDLSDEYNYVFIKDM